MEWAHARFGQIVPMNWESSGFDIFMTTVGFNIDDAYNSIVAHALTLGVEWLITIEDDVILPPNAFIKLEEWQRKGDVPVVSGLYYLKSEPTLPLVFRGRGNGAYKDFLVGDHVWCDGLPMGCLMIHTSLLRWVWDRSPEYNSADGQKLRKVFETPRQVFYDPESGGFQRMSGTQDLYFFDKLLEHDVLSKTGWKNVARKKWPFLCDTSIFCQHICRQTGRQYPGSFGTSQKEK